MNWKTFLLKYLRNLAISIVVCAAVIYLLGYLIGGRKKLLNMVYWGLVPGLIGSLLSGFGMIKPLFWGEKESYNIYPEWNWFIKKSTTYVYQKRAVKPKEEVTPCEAGFRTQGWEYPFIR